MNDFRAEKYNDTQNCLNNNNFIHTLSIVTSVVGEKILSIIGEVRDGLGKAPIGDGVHNFMSRRDFIPKDLDDRTGWRERSGQA